MTNDDLFTRDEALGGLPAQRASTLLYLIESRTAHLAARSRWVMEPMLSETGAQERELAFVEAFALGREPPLRPTVQLLERYAPQWAPLAPENPALRATLAHLLGQKYRLDAGRAPNIRAALGLDQEAVQRAYQRQYQRSIEAIYAPQMALSERLRWAAARAAGALESMPPFWSAFAMTVTETVGAGILALPIAMAGIGPLPGLVILVLMGLLNMLTVVAMAEALSRSGKVRYGGYLGGMVADYLGNTSSVVLSLGLMALNLAVLLAYFVGFSTTLAAATRLPSTIWAAALFLVILYYLRRKEVNATIASALLVGFSGFALILVLSALTLPHVRTENLLYVRLPWINGERLRPAMLELVFGTVLTTYFGHTSMGSCARVVLRRDPSARSLIYGSAAAILAGMALYAIWVLVVNGAVAPQALAQESGTSLVPLASRVGPVVGVLGSIYVMLSIAMVSIHVSLGIFHVVRERLPMRQQPVLVLPRQRARLILRPRGRIGAAPQLALTYLGIERAGSTSAARFRVEVRSDRAIREVELAISGRWDGTSLYGRFPELGKARAQLVVDVLDAHPGSVRLQVDSPLAMAYEGEWAADQAHLAGLLELPEGSRKLLHEMMRGARTADGGAGQAQGMTISELATMMGQEEDSLRPALADLTEQGMVRVTAGERGAMYRLSMAARGRSSLPGRIWQAVEDSKTAEEGGAQLPQRNRAARWAATALHREPTRHFLSLSPVLGIFLIVELLLLAGRESFSGPISLIGLLVASLLGGIFPVLLLAASRRKGDRVPGVVWSWLGHPAVLGSLYAIYLASMVLHGLLIWTNPWQRACALLMAAGSVAMTAALIRRKAFAPRTVIELREETRDGERTAGAGVANPIVYAITSEGRPAAIQVRLNYPEGEQCRQGSAGRIANPAALRAAVFSLPAQPGHELKIWAHRETSEGASESLPCRVDLQVGDQVTQHDLQQTGGQALWPASEGPRSVKVMFGAAPGP